MVDGGLQQIHEMNEMILGMNIFGLNGFLMKFDDTSCGGSKSNIGEGKLWLALG